MEDGEDSSCGHDRSTTTPVQPVPCDADDQSVPPTSPGKPEVNTRESVTSPEAGADASPRGNRVGVTCDAPASPTGAVSDQEREQEYRIQSPYRDVGGAVTSSSYFGESHVTRLQSFVDSVAAGDDMAPSTSWTRAHPSLVARGAASCSDHHRQSTSRPSVADEPLDLSVKSTVRRPDPTASSLGGEIPFPVPVVPPLFPLLACRESWIAHWAALAAASLQHSLLFPALSVTSPTGVDTTSGPGWMTSSSPRSSSSSSSPGGSKMAEERRRTALTAMESFVESSFKPRQHHHHHQQRLQRSLQPSARHDVSHSSTNRKRRRHLGAEMTSPGDEDGGSLGEKRKRTDVGNVRDRSVSPRDDDDATLTCDDAAEKRSPMTSLSKPEVNGDGGYLSCVTQDATKEHPLISLEKFVGVSAPLFRSPADPSDLHGLNGISSPVCRTPGMPDGKPLPDDDDSKMTSFGGDSAPEAAATCGACASTRLPVHSDAVSRLRSRCFAVICDDVIKRQVTSSTGNPVATLSEESTVAMSEHEMTEMSVYEYFMSFSSFHFAVVFSN